MSAFVQTAEQIEIMKSIKGIAPYTDTGIIYINNNGNRIGYLKAIDNKISDSEIIVSKLVQWRKKFSYAFITKFDVTFERTQKWLKNTVVPDYSRALFLVYDVEDKLFGHYGLKGINSEEAELDNTIRGEIGGPPKLFFHVELSLLKFCFYTLNVKRVFARVLSNNDNARKLHESVGLSVQTSKPLKLIRYNNGIIYEELQDETDNDLNMKMLYLTIDQAEFNQRYPNLDNQ